MNDLHASFAAGIALGKLALYFGCWDAPGHYLHDRSGRHLWNKLPSDFPSSSWMPLMDGGLLKNGRIEDVPTGHVYWTCGGAKAFWYAFYWWDRSVDRRGACNSGFYVRGFGWPGAQAPFDYACEQFPSVVARQRHPLVLQRL